MFIFPPLKYFRECHASTLVQLKDKRIFSAWFAGSKEGCPDTAIWMSHLDPDKKKWEEPFVIAKLCNTAHWNPVLFTDADKMYLFFKVGKIIDSWRTWFMVFENEKWSNPEKLVKSTTSPCDRGPVRSKPIVLSNGDWIAPSSVEKTINYNIILPNDVIWKAFVDIKNGGIWKKSKLIDFDRKKYGFKKKYGGVIQPTLWESSLGNVHMLLRSTAGLIFRSDSNNYGQTWCEAYPIDLPNNNSGIDVLKFNDILFLVYNPVSGNWTHRTPLSISISRDNGKIWSEPINIQQGQGSFSYPSLTLLSDGVGLTYTWNRISINFLKIKFNILKNVV